MLRNHLKVAWRGLWRNKLYTLINIAGLGFAMACTLLIALYTVDELTFDRFHSNAGQIYRIIETKSSPSEGDHRLANVSFKASREAVRSFPEVDKGFMMTSMGRIVLRNKENEQAFYENFLFAEPTVWDIFDFNLIAGDRSKALTEPHTVVLSQELSRKLFGTGEPIGQMIATDRDLEFRVVGVLEPIPGNSHLQFDALFSHATLKTYGWYEQMETTDWTSNFWNSYLLLNDHTDAQALENKLTALINKNRDASELNYTSTFQLQPLTDIHFYSEGIEGYQNAGKGNISYIYIFSLVGFFILLIGCINYMNLSTARSSVYGKEVGVRKVVGARRDSLMGRFFAESLLISLIAFVLAVNLVSLVLPAFNTFTGKAVSLNFVDHAYVLPILLGLVLLVSLIAGSYPAMYLSRFNPVQILKGKNQVGGSRAKFRQSLVVFQFVLSTIMIIGTLIAFSQLSYVQNKDLGFNHDQVVVVDINSGAVRAGFQTIKDGYSKVAAVKSVAVSSRVPGEWKVIPEVEVLLADQPEPSGKRSYFIGSDEDFLSTFEIELLEGRNFQADRLTDSSAVLINEQAAKLLGIITPGDQELILPKRIFGGTERVLEIPFHASVVGIVKDFHFQSLHEDIQPLIIGYRNNPIHSIDYFTVRIQNKGVEKTIAQLTDILHSVDPAHIFEYHFLDDQLQLFYETDQRRSRLFSIAALFAIFIACLGLFGLAAFTAEQRTKEIGIRKVLGASIANLVGLLSREFLQLVFLALLIATPIAWYAGSKWLEGFAYSIGISWWMFVVPGISAILIALLTVSYQAIRAALANPIKALRYE